MLCNSFLNSTLRIDEQFLQFSGLGFVTLGLFDCMWIDLFVFICVYFVCFRFILHSCRIIMSTVG